MNKPDPRMEPILYCHGTFHRMSDDEGGAPHAVILTRLSLGSGNPHDGEVRRMDAPMLAALLASGEAYVVQLEDTPAAVRPAADLAHLTGLSTSIVLAGSDDVGVKPNLERLLRNLQRLAEPELADVAA